VGGVGGQVLSCEGLTAEILRPRSTAQGYHRLVLEEEQSAGRAAVRDRRSETALESLYR
jgi:hypothetical protein